MRWVMSFLFVIQMYAMMAIMGIVFLPWALVSRHGARTACRTYCRWVRLTARLMVGLRTEVRGVVPQGEVLIASKHQSFLDIILIFGAVPAGKFIMKRELMWAPVMPKRSLWTVSPERSALMTRIDSSRSFARRLSCFPMAANVLSPPPMPVWITNGTLLIVASVPICSAAKTGCHSGRRNSAPIGRSVGHSAISRPIIGTFW